MVAVTRPSADPTRDRILCRCARPLLGVVVRRCHDARDRDTGGRDAAAAELPLQLQGRAVARRGRRAVRRAQRGDGRASRGPARCRRADRGEAARARVRRLLGDASAAASHHHARVQERRTADGLARGAPCPSALRADDGDVHPPRRCAAICPTSRPFTSITSSPAPARPCSCSRPECRRLAGIDPQAPDVVEAHADAVVALIFGH